MTVRANRDGSAALILFRAEQRCTAGRSAIRPKQRTKLGYLACFTTCRDADTRDGTNRALMIDLLKHPEGASVEQIAEATGCQHHTIRGAIGGALKKKLGLTVESIRIREVGPEKTGAKGSSTTYRIVA